MRAGIPSRLANERSRPAQDLADAIYQFLELHLGRTTVRYKDRVDSPRYGSTMRTHRLSKATFRAVALDGAAGPASGGDADTGGTLFAADEHVRGDGVRRRFLPFGVGPADVGRGGETALSWHQASAARYAESLARCLRRRRARIARPPGVRMRARNPWVRLRRRRCG